MKDTLKSPPPENQTMKKSSTAAILLTTTLYLCCACFGYAALPGNLLTGFGFYELYWLVDLANACVVLHLVGGYQVYSQPLFVEAKRWITKKLPDNEFLNNVYTIKIPMLPVFKLNLLRLCFRTTYVASTTGIALLFPYFNDVLGVLGALNFWPLAIYFPMEIRCWVHGGAYNFQIELRNVFAARARIKVTGEAFGELRRKSTYAEVECIDNTVIMDSKGISYPTRVLECMQQSHGYHTEEVINGGKSWVNDGSHGRVDQSSVFKQLGKKEDDADKVVRNDDLDVQGDVAENQWVDMEKTGLMYDDSCNSLIASIVKETARDLEIQIATVDPSGSKTSKQAKQISTE
ncbi:putative amino acid permease 7 [Camellia lanceoleosa]|uniref:Amino acid permease 7 n=1 Tax=Camellia lanceoleosa TaxID=1840588 RepID=A0ACC0H8Y7_9ERIC|nr:putative amino acid permease 7 [Camellia lanceoleosa]